MNEIQQIDSNKLNELLDGTTPPELLDVREQKEWNEGHIEAATFVPLSSFEESFEKLNLSHDKPIVLQCRSGKRSQNAAEFLQSKGYKNLFNLSDGILGWIEKGNPVKS